MLHSALRRAQNVHWQAVDITREAHAAQKGQSPQLLWFTGLSGSGKSTIANLVEKKLHALGRHSFLLGWRQYPPWAEHAIWASPMPTGSRISAASAKSPS